MVCRSAHLLVICLLLAGCRTQPYVNAHIESVNAEFRELEDYVYCLEDENARLQQELDAVRRGAVAPGATSSPAGSAGSGLFRRRPAGSRPPGEPTPPRIEANPATDVPRIEVPPATLPAPPGGAALHQHTLEQPASATSPVETESIPAKPADTKVTHLMLNPLLTGGADLDGRPGEDGLAVVLEPRNERDEYVAQAGPVSVVVLDPTREGEAARVARWDFDLSQARQMLATASPGRGIKLDLPWPAAPPANTHLKLFVRYETADGRRLQADREIHLTPPGQISAGWTPRPGAPLPAAGEAASLPAPRPEPASASPAAQPPAPPLARPAALSAAEAAKPRRAAWSPNR